MMSLNHFQVQRIDIQTSQLLLNVSDPGLQSERCGIQFRTSAAFVNEQKLKKLFQNLEIVAHLSSKPLTLDSPEIKLIPNQLFLIMFPENALYTYKYFTQLKTKTGESLRSLFLRMLKDDNQSPEEFLVIAETISCKLLTQEDPGIPTFRGARRKQ